MRLAAVAAWLGCTALAQTFDAAAIHPADPNVRGPAALCEGGRLTTYDATLRSLMQIAWNVRDFEIVGGPGWIDSSRWTVNAKGPATASDADCRRMTQALLIGRFQLAVHKEMRELPVYALVAAKRGPKLHESDPSERVAMSPLAHGFRAQKISMTNLARTLSQSMDHPVLDRTGLSGRYTFTLEWTPEGVDGAGPSIFTAVEEQLGLKLENQKSPVEVLAIDRVEKPSDN